MLKHEITFLAFSAAVVAQILGNGGGDDAYRDQVPLQHPPPIGPEEQSASRPNIVLVLTDDQDLHMDSIDYMPYVKEHLIDHGTFYKKHFCTTALCCPSRATLMTGKAAHNTNVTNVVPPYGGYPKFVSQGLNDKYLPVWLQDAGYNTYYTGKLFNAHSVDNYNSPHAAGWTSSDFLLDPFTYWYMNSTYQRNTDAPVSYEGRHSVEVLTDKALGLLGEAIEANRDHRDNDHRPFFLGIAPVAPHANICDIRDVEFAPPVPMERHRRLFEGVRVPRTSNFNPEKASSGASWIRALPRQTPENVDYNDHFYRQRLRTLQGVDELVDAVVKKLEKNGLLENTYIFYTTDNGYHIGQHRLQPAKQCSFEEDINIPLIVRGPGVAAGAVVTDMVTTHTDLAPTDFDGLAIPLLPSEKEKEKNRHEHVAVEHWGFASNEGRLFDGYRRLYLNNTYKALRVAGAAYNLHYQVWCSNERELYDLNTDPGQMVNLLDPEEKGTTLSSYPLGGVPLRKMVSRLDSLLFVLKSCKAETCIRPWEALHPDGDVRGLGDALLPRWDRFYEKRERSIRFDRCEMGFILDAEGPQYGDEEEGQAKEALRHQAAWHEWT
ncbi:arylsulfatase-like protein [Apiospora aurea]|uniref:Arylsulfatase n=1 Tax=Apiospora aurea TaxID=335848 RepID=A0ABR1QL81_9PEZI